jgi:hypothetical protein
MESLKTFEQRHEIKINWSFYAPMHGKSVVDGIGGTAKRFVRDRIKAQNLLLKSAQDFATVCKDLDIDVIPLSIKDVSKLNADISLAKIIASSKPIHEIKKKHSFEVIEGPKRSKKIIGFKISK